MLYLSRTRDDPEVAMSHKWFPVGCIILICFIFVVRAYRPAPQSAVVLEPSGTDTATDEEPSPPLPPKPFGNFTVLESAVAGLQCGMDSMSVLGVLGPPAFSLAQEDVDRPGNESVSWHYRDVVAYFGAFDALEAVEIIAPGVRTTFGITVGDSVARVERLYGHPSSVKEPLILYQKPADSVSGDAVVFRTQGGFVTGIFIGRTQN
jgi:hypothetical protein